MISSATSRWREMRTAIFGERFHFKTALTLEECRARIDAICAASMFGLNVADEPVGLRLKDRFWIYERALFTPPTLSGRLSSRLGFVHIEGRGGSNRKFVWAAILGFLFFGAVGAYFWITAQDPAAVRVMYGGPFFGVLIAFKFWENPRAGHLIDYLQQLLEGRR